MGSSTTDVVDLADVADVAASEVIAGDAVRARPPAPSARPSAAKGQKPRLVTATARGRRLHVGHFAFMRAVVQGVEVAASLEPVELDEASQLTVYRLVQESLTNMAKYAKAKHAEVTVRAYPNHMEVAVRDDGSGFDAARVKPSTHGLAGMRHRVEAAGGRLAVETRPGGGTRVSAVLPTRPRHA